jgi:hypothetical protein
MILIVRIILVQHGEHNIEDELVFANRKEYVFHDSGGYKAGDVEGLRIVQEFVHRKSQVQERQMNDKLHAIWLVPFDTYDYKSTKLPFQVLHSDGQCSVITRFRAF